MNYATIKKTDVANGPGVRVSLFVSGCTHHCKGCFNSEAWDFHYGQAYTEETEQEILQAENSLCKYSIQSFTAFDHIPSSEMHRQLRS